MNYYAHMIKNVIIFLFISIVHNSILHFTNIYQWLLNSIKIIGGPTLSQIMYTNQRKIIPEKSCF